MTQHRYTPEKLLKLNRQSSLSSIKEASDENINRAMGMFTSLNPTENIMNIVNPKRVSEPNIPFRDQQMRMELSPGMTFIIGVASTVVAGLILDWFKKRR